MRRELIRSWHSSRALLALLAGALLFAQAAVVAHELDSDTLHHDHVCATCVSASVFGGADLAATSPEFFAPHDKSIEPRPAGSVVAVFVAVPQARGPPATF